MATSELFLKLYLLVEWLELTICFTPTVHFGKSAYAIDEFVSVAVIPFRRCKYECLKRTRCNSLIYQTTSKLCKLGSKVIANSDVISASRSVLALGFDEYHNTGHLCGNTTCSLKETCVEKGLGIHQCEIKECGPPDATGFLGNMYSVGSKLILDGGSGYTIRCFSSGNWLRLTDTSLDHVIIGKDDCLSSNSFTSGIPLSVTGEPALCDVHSDGGNWLIFQRRQDGSENFYRGWDDYANGFGNLTGEFWLGLEELHTIMSVEDQFELRIDMENFAGEKRYAQYNKFNISDASNFYRLTIRGYSGTAGGDALHWRVYDGMNFSTFDNDNDLANFNCAESNTGAWWYNACLDTNLNGVYWHDDGNTTATSDNINWVHFTGFTTSLRRTEMKIRKASQ